MAIMMLKVMQISALKITIRIIMERTMITITMAIQ